jgi:site-specific DNA-methyltransferase (adenine-specific)
MKVFNDDCIHFLRDTSYKVDHIITDLPYGVTNLPWDSPIPFEDLWEVFHKVINPGGNIILFSSGLFTVNLINSNTKEYRYKLIWEKNVPTGMATAKYRPMKYYEEILVFGNAKATYNPVLKPREGVGKACYNYNHYCGVSNHLSLTKVNIKYDPDWVQPSDILKFNVVPNRKGKLHPTQKPVDLMEYLIKTYTNPKDIILDPCMGSGTTGVACIHTKRKFIGIEADSEMFNIAKMRIKDERRKSKTN